MFKFPKRKYKLIEMGVRRVGMGTLIATRDIPGIVFKGERGGYVDEISLSHEDTCWICPDAIVHDSVIRDSSVIKGISRIHDTNITGNSKINNSQISGSIIKDSEIKDSCIDNSSFVKYSSVTKSTLNEASIKDSVCRDSKLHNCTIENAGVYYSSISNIGISMYCDFTNAYIESEKDISLVSVATKDLSFEIVIYRAKDNDGDQYYTISTIMSSGAISSNDTPVDHNYMEDVIIHIISHIPTSNPDDINLCVSATVRCINEFRSNNPDIMEKI